MFSLHLTGSRPRLMGRARRGCLSRAPTMRYLFALLLWAVASPGVAASEPLSLQEAVSLAVGADDPTVARFRERASALEDQAVSDAQLPDPQLRVGLANFPTNTFDFSQEPMTQIQVGVRQSFPRGRTRSKTQQKRQAQAAEQRIAGRAQELQIALDTRFVWLDLYYWTGARETVAKSRQAVSDLVTVIEASFAAGVNSNQDLLRAELELSLLDDRAVDVEQRIDALTADLARLVGATAAQRALPTRFPSMAIPPAQRAIADALTAHPAVLIQAARIDVSSSDIDIARQDYKPGFSVDVGYGARGGNRPDFASAMVVLDIPLFTKNRQDRRVAAARKNKSSAQLDRAATLLNLRAQLDRTYATWTRLGERVSLFERVVINRADANADAALDGYQNQVADFAELIRSRLGALDADLDLLRLRVERAKAQSQLLFLNGDTL